MYIDAAERTELATTAGVVINRGLSTSAFQLTSPVLARRTINFQAPVRAVTIHTAAR